MKNNESSVKLILKIGEEIHFMKNDKPEKSTIKGISAYEGDCQMLGISKKTEVGQLEYLYHIGGYDTVEPAKAFKTIDELQKSLFETVIK